MRVVKLDGRGNVKGATESPEAYHTSILGVFAAGDMCPVANPPGKSDLPG